jgi:hypothetical protein
MGQRGTGIAEHRGAGPGPPGEQGEALGARGDRGGVWIETRMRGGRDVHQYVRPTAIGYNGTAGRGGRCPLDRWSDGW